MADELETQQETEYQAAELHPTVLFYVENDKFGGGTDQNYTNGFRLTFVSPDLEDFGDDHRLPALAVDLIRGLPFVNDPGTMHSVALSIGQALHTPANTDATTLIEDDWPYSAWLYGSIALHAKTDTVLDVFEISLGMVGPSAMGEEVQNNFHNFIGSPRSEGWDNQLHDEPGIILAYSRSWRALTSEWEHGLGMDLIPHAGFCGGNILTQANAGAQIRLGVNLPRNFGTLPILPGGDVSAPLRRGQPAQRADYGAHLFAGFDARAVARNIFLDGNTWEDSPHVSKKPFVADVFAGVGFQLEDLQVTYTQVVRSREFEGQQHRHVFGSLMLGYTF